jgi:signal transduction histidine kinase
MPDPGRESLDADELLLVARLRSGFWTVFGASIAFAIADAFLARQFAPLLAVKVIQCGMLLTGALVVGGIRDPLRIRYLGVAVVAGIYVTSAASAALRGEIVATAFLVVCTAMATAAFVPWGARPQLVTVVVAAAALFVDGLMLPAPVSEIVYRSMAVGVALAGSVWAASEHDRQRRKRRQAERQLADESRVSAALARAGEEMIRFENTPAILDGLCRLTVELLECELADLVMRDANTGSLVLQASHGHTAEEWEAVRTLGLPDREPLLERFAVEAVVQLETRAMGDSRVRRVNEQHGVAVSLYVPLRRAGEIVGILSAHYRRESRRFDRVQERIASGVAHLASMAMENARLVEELREANRTKSEFVSTMSHELRTPVSVILGYAEMLDDDLSPKERVSALDRLRRSGLELLDLVEETLNLSRLEAGKDPPRFEVVQVHEPFDELVGEFATLFPLDRVALRWQGPERFEVVTDRRKLRIILKNLMGNALKFTSSGEVVLDCRREEGVARFVVRDTGIGIAPEHLPIIFDMFRQADSSDARAYRGAGLGLHIVQRLVHQLGGEIHVASELGQGSAFTFTLPQPSVSAGPGNGDDSAALAQPAP